MCETGESLSSHAEDYLKSIFLIGEQGSVSTGRLSRELGVTAASVSSMLRKLSSRRLVDHAPHGTIGLTRLGEKAALEVIRHHRLVELFLYKMLGYALADVHEEAEHLEHTISEAFEERIAELLGQPQQDPHGSPIPDRDGVVLHRPDLPLTSLKIATQVEVCRLLHRRSDQLEYLESVGLIPGQRVGIVEAKPLEGPLRLRIGGGPAGREEIVSHELARLILVHASGFGKEKR